MISKPVGICYSRKMQWAYRILMSASVLLGAVVMAGILPAAWAGIAVAVGTCAGYFSDRAVDVRGVVRQ